MKQLLGNRQANRWMKHTLTSGQIPHATLFHGAEGLGKRCAATLFATAIFCKKGGTTPCGVCSACVKMQHGSHPDFTVVETSGKSHSYAVETVRNLRTDCAVMPNEADVRIFLIAEVERMTEAAYNAFLKTLEEPPAHVLFLLTATSIDHLPATILSRVVPVGLFCLSVEETAAALQARFPAQTADNCLSVATLCEGNLGKSEKTIEDSRFLTVKQDAEAFCHAVGDRKEYDLLQLVGRYEKDKEGFLSLLWQISHIARKAVRHRIDPTIVCDQAASDLAIHLSERQLLLLLKHLEQTQSLFSTNCNETLLLYGFVAGIGRQLL